MHGQQNVKYIRLNRMARRLEVWGSTLEEEVHWKRKYTGSMGKYTESMGKYTGRGSTLEEEVHWKRKYTS